jgi:hypothetical protein
MAHGFERQVADELARRAARRLEILREERPDLLAERMGSLDPDTLEELMELTRLPDPLSDREPRRRHMGIEGVDYCTNRLVLTHSARRREAEPSLGAAGDPDLETLDDEDLLAVRRYVPETLPGNVLG